MGFYHLTLDPDAQKLCTIVLPWGKCEHLHLPMGVCNSASLSPEHMSKLMAGLEFIRACVDNILCSTEGNHANHLNKLDKVFKQTQDANLRINTKKSFIVKPEAECSGFKTDWKGI